MAIAGGGFAALACLAHLVRFAESPLSVCVIAPEGFDTFGPAYATPRAEHLLNVRTVQMGLYADGSDGFFEWSGEKDPDGYLPRMRFGAYLKDKYASLQREAAAKGVSIRVLRSRVENIVKTGQHLRLDCADGNVAAHYAILATGNSFPPQDIGARYIENVWHYDFSRLPAESETIAVIGTGLTAVDVLVSLQKAEWKGKILCYSGNGRLPRPHPVTFEAEKVPDLPPDIFRGLRLSGVMREIRKQVRLLSGGAKDWAYVFYALRPHVPALWRGLALEDKKRALKKYLWLWNIYRHRDAAHLDAAVRAMESEGRLAFRRAKVTGAEEDASGVTLSLRLPDGTKETVRTALAFRCTGPSYRADTQMLQKNLLAQGMAREHETGFGLACGDTLCVGEGLYAVGPLLFGEYLETTAVPEIRAQAAKVAKTVAGLLAENPRLKASGNS